MSELIFGIFALAVALFIARDVWRRGARKRRRKRLEQYIFPAGISRRLKETYPYLNDQQVATVMMGLREYFAIALMANGRMVSMPSKAVDAAWHEFIVFTRGYQDFCRKVLGKFLHHTPAEAMLTPTVAQDGIKRAWQLSCLRENISPSAPQRLPLLFAIDAMLAIPGGYNYALYCTPGSNQYCAADIGCGGFSGRSSDRRNDGGGGDVDGNGSDGGGGDGGGCGGD
jgi:hypothetical protein